MELAIIMFGYPGSGKGAISRRLKEGYSFFHLGTGDVFRAMSENPQFEKEAQLVSDGFRLSDETVVDVVKSIVLPTGGHVRSGKNPSIKRVAFDGFPRSDFQAHALVGILQEQGCKNSVVIEMDAPRAVCRKRILETRAKEGRQDDRDPVKVDRRLDDFESYAPLTLQVLRQSHSYIPVDASLDEECVWFQVQKAVESIL